MPLITALGKQRQTGRQAEKTPVPVGGSVHFLPEPLAATIQSCVSVVWSLLNIFSTWHNTVVGAHL